MTSQFTVYTSNDVNAPLLTGLSGSILDVLDGCLVNGYGTKTAAGWTKPIPNSGSMGCYKQPSGSLCTLFVNDAAPVATSSVTPLGSKEAWAVGYTYLQGFTGSLVGTGNNAFPQPGQTYTVLASGGTPSGSMIWRKSTTADATPRQWVMFADAWTFYLFVITGDTAGTYDGYWFGDIYSLSNSDSSKCMIRGREASSAVITVQFDTSDTLHLPTAATSVDQAAFISNTAGGRGGSTPIVNVGDLGKGSPINRAVHPSGTTAVCGPMSGQIVVSNPIDNSLYMSPIWVSENPAGQLRGRIRGMYHLCHPITNFIDGQNFGGANEYVGKTFQIVKQGPIGGMWVIETSNTVETN